MRGILTFPPDPDWNQALLERVIDLAGQFESLYGRKPVFMEVCGSHTMALARSGLKKRLKNIVTLISGPGCPVCVTDQQVIDSMIALAEGEYRVLCTFGDMMRVPGSQKTLQQAKAEGRDIRVVYSPVDAVELARRTPDKEVIFLGIGFETTIPVLGAALKEADEQRIGNFSMRISAKLVEPILRHLIRLGEVVLDGFLLPGHVSIIVGSDHFAFLADEYGMPGVISGFEPFEMVRGIHRLLELAVARKPAVLNDHPGVVTREGNAAAKRIMNAYFEPCGEVWRGIGPIPNSGLSIRPEYGHLDAGRRFPGKPVRTKPTGCRCGEVIRGVIQPADCGLFGKTCSPHHPVGPCMVSAEGSCAAEYHYIREG